LWLVGLLGDGVAMLVRVGLQTLALVPVGAAISGAVESQEHCRVRVRSMVQPLQGRVVVAAVVILTTPLTPLAVLVARASSLSPNTNREFYRWHSITQRQQS
jgi:hypothetical protein